MNYRNAEKRHFIKGPKITTSLRMPKELKRKLQSLAKSHGFKFSEFVQEGLDQWALVHSKTERES